MTKGKNTVKCLGRFSGLRDALYKDALPLILGDRTLVTGEDLKDAWELIEGDVNLYDAQDPYYDSRTDRLRRQPSRDSLSLVPLMESPAFHLEKGLVGDYAFTQGNSFKVIEILGQMADEHSERFFKESLGKEPSDIVFDGGRRLSGYRIAGNFGVGTISMGGISGGGLRSDSPYLLEVYAPIKRGQFDLAATVGFWVQDNEMLVSQMQSCRNARFPEGVPFGVGCLTVAEKAARGMGLDTLLTYSARNHPIFREHPKNWKQFGKDFVALYDNSAKKRGFSGGRNEPHEKDLRSS
jgi:hypothetical protein